MNSLRISYFYRQATKLSVNKLPIISTFKILQLHHTITMKRIIIGLDFTEMDEALLIYTNFWIQLLDIEKIYFLHITDSLSDDIKIRQQVWNTNKPLDEFLQGKMKEQVQQFAPQLDLQKTEFLVVEGTPYEQMHHWALVKEVDLIIAGRKYSLKGSGLLPQKFIMNAPCSVLLIPETVATHLDTVLVSTDFSEYSQMALQVGVDLVRKMPFSSLYCLHIFDVEEGITTDQTYLEMVAQKRQAAEIAFNQSMMEVETYGHKITPLFVPSNDELAFQCLYQNAKDIEASLIVVGTKGRSFLTRFFDDSFTKQLIETNNKIPLLVVKA